MTAKEEQKLTLEQIKEMLRQEEQKNMQVCMQKVNVVLREHKCKLGVTTIIQDEQISSRIDLVTLD